MKKDLKIVLKEKKEMKHLFNLENYFFPPQISSHWKKNPLFLSWKTSLKTNTFASKGQAMLLNFNMLINCQIIISMELNLNSTLILNELTKANLIVMNTNTFNYDWLLIF